MESSSFSLSSLAVGVAVYSFWVIHDWREGWITSIETPKETGRKFETVERKLEGLQKSVREDIADLKKELGPRLADLVPLTYRWKSDPTSAVTIHVKAMPHMTTMSVGNV